MKTLGVTGGIGSGKSTVCKLLAAHGAEVFYADAEAKRLQVEDESAKAEIVRTFGAESYLPDGTLNRGYLAAQVFGNAEKLQQLNAIVHPRVRAALETRKAEAKAKGAQLLVYEAALIFETGGEKHVDAVLVVEAPPQQRIAWVQQRDHATQAQIEARMKHQLPPDELRRRADFVIENDGSLESLAQKVEAFWQDWVIKT